MNFLTPRQREILDLVNGFYERHGYYASYGRLQTMLKLQSKSTVAKALAALRHKGFLNDGNRAVVDRHYTKKRVSEERRWEVFERDNYTCQVCGSKRCLTVDHKDNLGSDDMENLQTLCRPCNSHKRQS